MPIITLPDGKNIEFQKEVTGLDIAQKISKSLSNQALIMSVNGELKDGDGNFGSSGQLLTSDGTDTKWDASSNLPAGSSAKIAITDVTSGTTRLLLSTGSGTQKDVLSNSNLTYNTSTQVITGKISTISNHDTDD